MRYGNWVVIMFSACLLVGCGGGGDDYKYTDENPDSPEVVYANDVRSYLADMKDGLQDEGPQSIDFEGYFEGMEGYGDEPPVGSHGETYKKIDAGVKELQGMVNSKSSRADLMKKINELIAATGSLPAEAESPDNDE